MCWPHWCRVPKALNRAVFAAYRALRSPGGPEAYREARDAAIAAVVAKEAESGPTRTATCIVTDCRKLTPPGEPFCSVHRD